MMLIGMARWHRGYTAAELPAVESPKRQPGIGLGLVVGDSNDYDSNHLAFGVVFVWLAFFSLTAEAYQNYNAFIGRWSIS